MWMAARLCLNRSGLAIADAQFMLGYRLGSLGGDLLEAGLSVLYLRESLEGNHFFDQSAFSQKSLRALVAWGECTKKPGPFLGTRLMKALD